EGFLKESTKINQESFPNSDKNEDECDGLLLLLKLKPSQNRKWLFNGENISKNLLSKKNKGIKKQTCSLDYGILNIQDPLANRYLPDNFIEHYKKFSAGDSKDYITIDDIGTKIKKLCLISDNLLTGEKCKHGNKVDGMVNSKSILIQWFWKELKLKVSSKSDEDKIKLENGVKYLLVNLFLGIPIDLQDKFHDLEVYVVQAIEDISLVVVSLKNLAALKDRIDDENTKSFIK
ncbi:8662_t:CDS:2, partial [Entrophospora sp. SA101]